MANKPAPQKTLRGWCTYYPQRRKRYSQPKGRRNNKIWKEWKTKLGRPSEPANSWQGQGREKDKHDPPNRKNYRTMTGSSPALSNNLTWLDWEARLSQEQSGLSKSCFSEKISKTDRLLGRPTKTSICGVLKQRHVPQCQLKLGTPAWQSPWESGDRTVPLHGKTKYDIALTGEFPLKLERRQG